METATFADCVLANEQKLCSGAPDGQGAFVPGGGPEPADQIRLAAPGADEHEPKQGGRDQAGGA